MSIKDWKKKFPQIYGKDHGRRMTLGDVVAKLGKALDANASKESVDDVACDVLDRDFLFGAWGSRWADGDADLLRDLRGIIIAAYRAGKRNRQT